MKQPAEPAPAIVMPPISQMEGWWVVGICLAAALMRLIHLDRLAIEHFDEAVYASNLWFGPDSGYEYPQRPLYAPPLVPALIEWTTILWTGIGLPNTAWLPMVPGLFCGIALTPSLWWILRQWFGWQAGVAGAAMAALSGYHIYYSRTALTDPILVLAMLWAVHASWKMLVTGNWRWAIAAGLLTALAWWTKYNGWLPIAIAASGGAAYWLLCSRDRQLGLRWAGLLLLMMAVAALAWSPVLQDCESVGGYGIVTANHRSYIMGWSSWWSNFLRQSSAVSWYEEGPLAFLMGILVPKFIAESAWIPWKQNGARRWFLELLFITPIILISMFGRFLEALIILSGWMLVELAIRKNLGMVRAKSPSVIAAWLLAAWFAGLLLVTPLYYPYPRLCLPLWLAGTCICAWWIHYVFPQPSDVAASTPVIATNRSNDTIVYAILGLIFVALSCTGRQKYEPRTSARQVAQALRQKVADPARVGVYAYNDPGLFYQLASANFTALPYGELDLKPSVLAADTWLALGPFAREERGFAEKWDREQERFELVETFDVEPSTLVLFDSISPLQLQANRKLRQKQIEVYRVR